MIFAEIAPCNIILPSSFRLSLLIVICKWLKECLRMLTRWTELRGAAGFDDIATVATLPHYLAITTEEIAIGKTAQKFKIATLVLLLHLSNVLKRKGDFLEVLSVCSLSKGRIQHLPLFVLAICCFNKVMLRCANDTRRK